MTKVTVVKLPLDNRYVTVSTPAAIAETRPVNDPIVARDVLLLLQVPPAKLSVSVMDVPAQRLSGPSIGPGPGGANFARKPLL